MLRVLRITSPLLFLLLMRSFNFAIITLRVGSRRIYSVIWIVNAFATELQDNLQMRFLFWNEQIHKANPSPVLFSELFRDFKYDHILHSVTKTNKFLTNRLHVSCQIYAFYASFPFLLLIFHLQFTFASRGTRINIHLWPQVFDKKILLPLDRYCNDIRDVAIPSFIYTGNGQKIQNLESGMVLGWL